MFALLLHGYCKESEGLARKLVNQTSLLTEFNPTDRPKSVRNLCGIEHFGGVLCCQFVIAEFSVV